MNWIYRYWPLAFGAAAVLAFAITLLADCGGSLAELIVLGMTLFVVAAYTQATYDLPKIQLNGIT